MTASEVAHMKERLARNERVMIGAKQVTTLNYVLVEAEPHIYNFWFKSA